MRTVYKYALSLLDVQSVALPKGARILMVGAQSMVPCLWALVDTEQPSESRTFRILTTGAPMWDVKSDDYIGTFQIIGLGGPFVGHIFEVKP